MEAAATTLPALLQALGLWLLLPMLAAGLLGTEWGSRRGPVARGLLLGLTAALGARLGQGLTLSPEPAMLFEMVRAVRAAPSEYLARNLPPQLLGLVTNWAAAQGKPLAAEVADREAGRLLGLLLETREIPDPLLPARLPGIFQRMVQEGERPGLLAGLLWSPQVDPALGLVLGAGIEGGAAGGLAAALLAMAFRRVSLGTEPAWLLPTLVAGLLGAAARRALGDPARIGPAFALGALAGLAQLGLVVLRSPVGYMRPEVLAGGLVLVLGTGATLASLAGALRGHRLDRAHREARQAESESRLALLTAQVRPHFLFNALNTIASTCAEDPTRARHLIDCLSRFLRLSLRPSPETIPLAEELAALEPYLELQRARFPDRLRIVVQADDPARAGRLPPLVLQPLVENAIHHGMPADGRLLQVEIAASREADGLVVRVRDDGPGAAPTRLAGLNRGEGLGIGLGSVRERVRARRPPGSLVLQPRSGAGVEAILHLPDREE